MTALDPRTIVSAMGGVVTGRDSCNVPGPGHSPKDTSLSIKIDPTAPLGFRAHSFADDDWRTCRDYVAAALSLKCSNSSSGFLASCGKLAKDKSRPSEFPLKLWSEAINAGSTLAERH